jgi:hypothetical protein
MGYTPRTSSEINQFHIERTLKKLQRNEIRVQDADLNKRFDRLKKDNEWMHEELYAKYVEIVRSKSMLSLG